MTVNPPLPLAPDPRRHRLRTNQGPFNSLDLPCYHRPRQSCPRASTRFENGPFQPVAEPPDVGRTHMLMKCRFCTARTVTTIATKYPFRPSTSATSVVTSAG